MVKVNVDNTPLILDATSPYSAEAVVDHYLNGDELNRFDFQVFSSFSSLPFPNNPSHPNYKSYTWGFAVYSSAGLVYFNKDGQRENLDQTTNESRQSIGSGSRFNQPYTQVSVELGEELLGLDGIWIPYVLD